MACGAEMALMNVVQDDTMAVPGFEHHTFMCSGCGDVEQRLVFAQPAEPSPAPSPVVAKPAEPLPPLHAAPPISPAPGVRSEPAPAAAPIPAAPGLLQRVFARLRGRHDGGKTADA
jgi:hypothetical protein